MTGAGSLFDTPTEDRRATILAEGLEAARSELRGGTATPSGGFGKYVQRHNPTLLGYEHIPRLVDIGERIVAGVLPRVLVIMPPRYFKSEVFSRLLPGYFLRQNPDRHVGLASYGAQLAWELSEEARNYFEADGGIVRPETAAKRRWRSRDGGEMWADGVGGSLLGRGWHLGIIDDPTDPEKAHSPTFQRRFEDWFPSKFISRQEPSGALVVVMQRLGVGDPIEFLFRREVGEDTDEAPEHWHVVVCDEMKSTAPLGRWGGPMGLPPTCTLEPDPREPGEVLAPTRFTPAEVQKLQIAAGSYVAAAQRQQRPSAPTGEFWKADYFEGRVYDELPANAFDGGWDWDLAYTKNEANSASAGVKSFKGPPSNGNRDNFPIYIDDVDWDWLEFPELVAFIKAKDGPHYIEDKASGKSADQTLQREGVASRTVKVDGGDKFARASAVQPIASNRRVWISRRVKRKLLEGERQGLLRVTAEALLAGGPDLDVNDAFVQALNRHAGRRRTMRVAGAGTPKEEAKA